MPTLDVPLFIRGTLVEGGEREFDDRHGSGQVLRTPDVGQHLRALLNDRPSSLLDLLGVPMEEILDFLHELSLRLNLDTNPHWKQAFEASCASSNLSEPVLRQIYRSCPRMLSREVVREIVESQIGSRYLDGWVPQQMLDGRTMSTRAFGARGVHIIAGNVPIVAVASIMRSAVTRSDSIIKIPANDPLTAVAVARTMRDISPDHPLVRHLSVAYWKGGDEAIESRIYDPRYIEKIVAWGGFASIKHISRYLQPGIDLITLDPKSSTTLIGREALVDDATMRDVARRAAADIGAWDQEACANARVLYLESGRDRAGLVQANLFGRYVYEAMQQLPRQISSGAQRFSSSLKAEIEAIAVSDDWFAVYMDAASLERSGAVIVSQLGEQVDFAQLLSGRVGNIVPVDNIDEAIKTFTASTQTVGVYPDALKQRIRDRAAISGAQVLVSLGYATAPSIAGPQDGIEPMRRMCKWVQDNVCDPAIVPGPWSEPAADA